MRQVSLSSLVSSFAIVAALLVGCGPAKSSTTPPAGEPSSTASAQPEATAAPSADASASASASASAAASAAPSAPAVVRAAPTLKGSLLGKPFEAAAACLAGVTPSGNAYIEIYDDKGADVAKSCGVLAQDKGARKIGIELAWKNGEKLDLATIKAPKKDAGPPLFVMERINEKKADRKDAGKDFKPKGEAEVLRTAGKDGVGRIRIAMTAGKDKLEGEIDVEVKADVQAP
jgi:hypothetical protein